MFSNNSSYVLQAAHSNQYQSSFTRGKTKKKQNKTVDSDQLPKNCKYNLNKFSRGLRN